MLKNLTRKQIFIPIVALLLLAAFNLIMDPSFYLFMILKEKS